MPVSLRVELLSHTERPFDVLYLACRQCYSPGFVGDGRFCADVSQEEKESLIKKVIASGHESPLEHVSFTFAIEGISRACSHQLVRHRIASYSQQSQRYVSGGSFEYIIPPSIAGNPQAKKIFEDAMAYARDSYNRLLDALSDGESGRRFYEDARFVLPNAAETKIVVSMNARELGHFFAHRLCARAQWEIRALAKMMAQRCRDVLPVVFETADAKCATLGYCPEGRFSCGRYPVRG